jgi:hypothetical protein
MYMYIVSIYVDNQVVHNWKFVSMIGRGRYSLGDTDQLIERIETIKSACISLADPDGLGQARLKSHLES